MRRKREYNFVGIPTRILERELERRASLAYHRRVNAEFKARDVAGRTLMPETPTGTELDGLDYLYGGGDETIECRSVRWVVTRHSHKCVSLLHKGAMTIPAGSRMLLERAKCEGQFGSCYTCEDCIKKSIQEITDDHT